MPASLLLNRAAKLSEMRDILGHASPVTTKKVYAHCTVSRLHQAFDTYSRTLTSWPPRWQRPGSSRAGNVRAERGALPLNYRPVPDWPSRGPGLAPLFAVGQPLPRRPQLARQ